MRMMRQEIQGLMPSASKGEQVRLSRELNQVCVRVCGVCVRVVSEMTMVMMVMMMIRGNV